MGDLLASVRNLAYAAREYCGLIEGAGASIDPWLERLTRVLPRIHAAVLALERVPGAANTSVLVPDYDLRFDLFTRLRDLLGERDAYPMDFDAGPMPALATGSLADDITDIYFELRHGLDLFDCDRAGPERAAGVWRDGFLWHWGQHLVDAERHLYRLAVNRHLCSRSGPLN